MDPGVGGVVWGTCSPPPLQECLHNISAIIIACTSQEMFQLYRASGAELHYPLPGVGCYTTPTETPMA